MYRSSTEKVMHLDGSLKTVSAFAEPQQFESIRQHIDPAWVAEALAATGTATVRGAGRCCALSTNALGAVAPYLMSCKWFDWWGGWCFGHRPIVDISVLLAFASH